MKLQFVTAETGVVDPKTELPASYLRRRFELEKKPVRGSLSITALGVYQAYVNGEPVDHRLLKPGFTDYKKRVQVQNYDVTDRLTSGENVIAAVVGDGWYKGSVGAFNKRNTYGTRTALAFRLEVEYEDGSSVVFESDEKTRATKEGPLRENNLKTIERYDATKELQDWLLPIFDDSGWYACEPIRYEGSFVPDEGEPVTEHESFSPKVFVTPDGNTVLDFGQNLAGHVSFRVTGHEGQKVSMIMGETLDENGNFTLKNIQGEGNAAKKMPLGQRLDYLLKEGTQEYCSQFLISGYRYVLVLDWPEPVRSENFKSIAVYSDLAWTGQFHCSNELINRLVENVIWSEKSNFVDIPADCPQRERAGWTGDMNVFNETADYLSDTRVFLRKWMHDFIGMQREDGSLPYVVPHIPMIGESHSAAGWSDAIVTVPWMQYWFYQDTELMREVYPYAKKWVDFNEMRAGKRNVMNFWKKWYREKYVLDTGFHFGEWLEPGSDNLKDGIKAFLHPDYEVATAWFYYSAFLLSQMAGALGEEEDAKHYRRLSEHIKIAYEMYFLPTGTVRSRRQCKYVRPLYMGLVPEAEREEVAARLNEQVVSNQYRIGTGFLTTYQILNVLTDNGYTESAYRMLENEECPGWLYEVKQGATTVWEGWDASRDGVLKSLSLNHYSPGAAISWLFSRCAGIRPLAPGFQKIQIRPYPGGSLTWAKAEYESIAGKIASSWTHEKGEFSLTVTIPEGVDATVILPDGTTIPQAKSGTYTCNC